MTDGVMIKDVQYDVISWIDEYGEEVDPNEATVMLLQRPEDRRPDGTKQEYKVVRIIKGSAQPMTIS